MRKKVLLLNQVFPPETNAGAHRIGSMAKVLSKYYDIDVVTLKPSHPSPELYRELSLKHHDLQLPYKIRRTFNFHPHKGGLLIRALREQVMAFRLAAHAVPIPADIVMTSPPTMFLGPIGLMLAKAKRAKFICDVRDITWQYGQGIVGSSPIMTFGIKVLERYMLSALRRADLVIGATPGVTQRLVESGLAPEKAITVSNGISPDLLNVAQKTDENSTEPRPVVAYVGLFGYNYNIGILLDVASMLPGVHFVLVGDGPELPLLKRRAKELDITNVTFRGYLVDQAELLKVYEASDILFAKMRDAPIFNAITISAKLYEYMATGRPLVYGGKGVAVDFLRKIGCAVTVPPEDPKAIAAAIQDLLRDPDRMRILGSKGRDFMRQNYHRDTLMEGLARELEERFGDKRSRSGLANVVR